MADGQQIDSATGTLGDSRLVPLKSRKAGTGAATQSLVGSAVAFVQGAFQTGQRLAGSALSAVQGALSVEGQQTSLGVNFTLTSAAGGTDLPWAFGHAFKQGDVPSGQTVLTSGANSSQFNIKTTWPDGSAKFGILSGRADFTAGVAKAIGLLKGPTVGGTDLTTTDLQNTGITASFSAGSYGSASFSGADFLSPFQTWITGPVMSSWIYRKEIGSDPLLVAWLHVRLWAGGTVHVRAIVENGYLDNGAGAVASNADKSYIPGVTIAGVSVYTNGGATLTHYRNTRWMVEHWIGTDPQITPKHNVAYLRSTKLVPNYYWTSPSESKLNSYTYVYTPMSNGNIPAQMEGTGFSEHIGLLPNWDALYCTTGDARAYRACINNAHSINSRAIVWRSKNTNLIPTPSAFPTWTLSGPGQGGLGPVTRGTLSYEVHHSPNEGYLAYLLTGEPWHLDTMAMCSSFAYFGLSSARGSGTSRINRQDQVRGIAWAFRTVGCYAGVAPNGDTVAANYRDWLSIGHCTYWAGQGPYNVNAKQLGWPVSIGTYDESEPIAQAPWMYHFWMQAHGFVWDINPGFSSNTDFQAIRDWMYKGAVGILGPNGSDYYCFTKASNYVVTISPLIVPNFTVVTPDNFYSTWGEVYTATFGAPNTSCSNTLEGTSGGGPGAASTGYWGNLMPAIAYAVDHGASGALAAWDRLTGASNWSVVDASGFDNVPIWGITPRDYAELPSWIPAEGTFANISLNTLNEAKPAGWPATGSQSEGASPFVNWSSGIWAGSYGSLGAYVVRGSGHLAVGTPLWCGVNLFDLSTRLWTLVNRPVVNHLSGEAIDLYSAYPDGHVYPKHTYFGLGYRSPAQGGGSSGELVSVEGFSGLDPVYTHDLVSVNGPPTRRVNDTAMTSQYGGYTSLAVDSLRNGFWLTNYVGDDPIRFVSFSDWSVTTYTQTFGAINAHIIYIPAPYDCLVAINGDSGTGANFRVRVLRLSGASPSGSWTIVTQSGTPPNDGRCGGVWSTLLGCIVSYQARGSYVVHKLTPPAPASLTTGTWAWTSETLTGVSGATPVQNTAGNGGWARFVEAPELKCFLWADSVSGPVQAWRLTGMV